MTVEQSFESRNSCSVALNRVHIPIISHVKPVALGWMEPT